MSSIIHVVNSKYQGLKGVNRMNTKIIKAKQGLFLLKQNPPQESNWRSDNLYKFIYALDGQLDYQTPRHQLKLNQHQFMLINPHDEHKQWQIEKRKFLIELHSDSLNQAASSLGVASYDIHFSSSVQQNQLLSRWALFLTDYLSIEELDEQESLLFLEHSFSQLILLLLKQTVGTHQIDIPISVYKHEDQRIYLLLDALKQDYRHPWTLDEMAKVAQQDKFQLSHAFTSRIGISPYAWLQQYRLVRSQQLLRYSQETILSIAYLAGFSSLSVYNRLFKRTYGFTPSAFRKWIRR